MNTGDIVKLFQEPSRAARPYVWWHWMDGEVSLDGIKKDLEWMDAVGIAGFHQFDAGGVNMPKAAAFKRPYLSDSWKDAFRYAVKLADSLDMEMTVASAPGWSSTGGPWVSPEDAMKKLEWQTVDVDGGRLSMVLPELQKIVGPYRDIPRKTEHIATPSYGYDVALMALRLPDGDLPMEALGASSVLEEDGVLTVSFPKKVIIRSFTLKSKETGFRPREGSPYGPEELQCSNDGKNWKTIKKINKHSLLYTTENIPPTKARYFRVIGGKPFSLELNTASKVEQVEYKGGFGLVYDFMKMPTGNLSGELFASSEDVIDLSGKLTEDGRLECILPEGRWRIYRFGASLTGKMNHPASPNATGLEVDKLNKEAWSRYFHHYIDMYKEAAGGMLGARGISHILVDSYEANTETWSPCLPAEFKKRRGYDLLPWMPVLTGQILCSAEKSEQFLRDWRKTLGELFTENYGRINDFVEEYGMKGTYIESHESGRAFVGDGMDAKKRASVPMSAIWMTDSPTGSMLPSAISDIRESASVAHIYGQNIAAAESFTANGEDKRAYTYHPANIKMIADIALASGLNRFIIHDSASQPSDDYLPGLGLFKYGQWFHRNDTWAQYAKYWTDYLSRSCQILQLGRNVADILVFYGEDTNATAEYGGEYLRMLPEIPVGSNFDYASPDVLLNMVHVEDGCLVTASGQKYKYLMLGPACSRYMSEEISSKIKEFVAGGVKLFPAEGIEADVTFSGMSGTIYGDEVRKNKKGHDATLGGLQFVHRELPEADIYWIANFTGESWSGKVSFRSGQDNAAIFDAVSGKAFRIACSKGTLDVCLNAGDAMFYVLSDEALDLPQARSYSSRKEILTLDRYWDVVFEQKGGEKAVETFSVLNDWSTNSDPVVKYFSGTANYKSSFELPAGALSGAEEVRLDLGTVNVMAELIINGHNTGLLWREPYLSADILDYLKEGNNTVELNVTNLWVNRMIGDRQRGEKPVTKVRRFYTAGDRLLPSGLLGPVRLIAYSE